MIMLIMFHVNLLGCRGKLFFIKRNRSRKMGPGHGWVQAEHRSDHLSVQLHKVPGRSWRWWSCCFFFGGRDLVAIGLGSYREQLTRPWRSFTYKKSCNEKHGKSFVCNLSLWHGLRTRLRGDIAAKVAKWCQMHPHADSPNSSFYSLVTCLLQGHRFFFLSLI